MWPIHTLEYYAACHRKKVFRLLSCEDTARMEPSACQKGGSDQNPTVLGVWRSTLDSRTVRKYLSVANHPTYLLFCSGILKGVIPRVFLTRWCLSRAEEVRQHMMFEKIFTVSGRASNEQRSWSSHELSGSKISRSVEKLVREREGQMRE